MNIIEVVEDDLGPVPENKHEALALLLKQHAFVADLGEVDR
nr:hypothetical protein [uncultured Cohaesibacter sp.]